MIHKVLDIDKNLLNDFYHIKQLSKQKQKAIIKKIDITNALKNKNYIHIVNYILIIYAIKNAKALTQLKRENIFLLNINSKNQLIIKIINYLLKNFSLLELNQKDIKYLHSKKNLALISEDIYDVSQKIRKEIKNYGNSFTRDILFIVDMHFYRKINNIVSIDIPIETLSEICSFLIYLNAQINKKHIISENTFTPINRFNEKKLYDLIYLSFTIRNFQDIEKFIDNFDYQCVKNNNTLIISSEDCLLEKSRRYGDFYSNMQRTASRLNTEEVYSSTLSFSIFIEKLSNNSKSFFKFAEYPIKRYIFNFPITSEIIEFLCQDKYFKEEVYELEEIKKEYGIKDMMSFKISTILTLKDLMIIKRVFRVMTLLNSKFLYSILEQDQSKKDIVYNSWIKAFKHETLKNILIHFIGNDKADEFILEFSWLLQSNKKLDLQYTPLVKFHDYYFPMNIFINSNSFRNCLFKNKIRPQDTNQDDLITKSIQKVLTKNFEHVKIELNFNKNGYRGEFDIIAYINNTIYIFESKNIMTSTDLHELRSIYKDNLLHGFEQLSKCRNVLLSDGYIEDLNNNLQWNISSDFKIVTCLVLGTRMFNGYTDGQHHVRSFHELFNFLDSGKIEIRDNDRVEEINLWENEEITEKDIYDFIENSTLHKLIFESFSSQNNEMKLKKYNITFETFEFELMDFYEKLKL